MAFDFSTIGKELANPFVVFWNAVVDYLPGIVAAIIILVVGYFIAALIGLVIRKIVEHTKLDEFLIKRKIEKPHILGGARLSRIIGKLIKWWVFIIFLTPAANVIKLGSLAGILTTLALWLPHLIAAIVIMIVGMLAAEFLSNIALHAKQLEGMKAVSIAIRVVVIVFFALIALREIGINITLAETTLMMIIAAVLLVLVIGFGVALIKPAQSLLEGWMKKIK